MPTLKEQLVSLVELQKLDSQIYALRREKAAYPEALKAAEAAFEEKKQGLAALEKHSLGLQAKKKEHELELASKEESTKKLQVQLYTLKTNKEYQAMLQQIADSKADTSVIEDKILAIMEQSDQSKADAEKEKVRLKDEEKVFLDEKKQGEQRLREIEERLTQLEAMRNQLSPAIEPKIRAAYERILANRDGLAIVNVRNNSCGGCNMFVPAQVINLIRMYEHTVTCESCNRILYIDETA